MIPDRMGIIGNMHGVNASSRPKPKKAASSAHVLPPAKRSRTRPSSDGSPVVRAGAAASGEVAAASTTGTDFSIGG
jgi:hypothetical protein